MMVRRPPPFAPSRVPKHRSSGFTLVEVAVSAIVVSVMMVAALRAVSASRTAHAGAERRATARLLADDLMGQIGRVAYTEPGATTLILGPEVGELLAGKAAFDDIDDFNGWTESPPTDVAGASLSRFTNWSRTVTVAWVGLASPSVSSVTETGAKRITVIVKYGTAEYARCVAMKSNAPAAK